MIQGAKVELILEDGRMLGYYQYVENKTMFISMDYSGMYSVGILKSDIKKIIEL